MESWLNKYKPTNLENVVGHSDSIQKFRIFLEQFDKSSKCEDIKYPNLLITGSNGLGKMLICDLVLQEKNFTKIIADLSTVLLVKKSKKKENSALQKNTNSYYLSILNRSIFETNSTKKFALVISDTSNISNSKEKDAIKSIVKLNNKFHKYPIIIIANIKHNKTVNEIRKMVTYTIKVDTKDNETTKKSTYVHENSITLKPPQYNELYNFIVYIEKKEKINFVKDKTLDIYEEIICQSQSDIRRLINMLQDIKLIYGSKPITVKTFAEYCDISRKKDIDPGIFEATRQLLNEYRGINESLTVYSEERATIPLMIHENYPSNIKEQYSSLSLSDQINLMFNISKSISISDKIDGIIYSNQCWNLQNVHGFYSCVLPSYEINKIPNKKCFTEHYRYTQDYNKTSIKKINNKVIKKAKENIKLKQLSINDFLCMSSILKTLFINKNYEQISILMRPYMLKLSEIESIIKIDKIKKSKYALNSKNKTLLKKLLNVSD